MFVFKADVYSKILTSNSISDFKVLISMTFYQYLTFIKVIRNVFITVLIT